jgi:ATP-dependent Clp protease adaptor protein ClpS
MIFAGREEGTGMSQTTGQTAVRPGATRPKPQPPYAVILENDDLHTFNYVIDLLQKVFGYGLEKSLILTKAIHHSGESLVWSGSLEVAELKRDQVRGYGPDFYPAKPVKFPLGVRLESMPGD